MIEFKKLSSVEVVEKINKLSDNDRITAYREHSVLIKKVGQIYLKNRQKEGNQFILGNTLPVLISAGWTEEAARDALSWNIAKSFIILAYDPSYHTPQSDAEIRITLKEDKSLTEEVIDAIFKELYIDFS